jgi:hypothetical protein
MLPVGSAGSEPFGAALGERVWAGRPWRPRLWLGANLRAWTRLLVRNRFAVGWRHLSIFPEAAVSAVGHTLLGAAQQALLGRRIEGVSVEAPLFVLGHWRSGTTWIHELLTCDPRHAAPTTYECFAPGHFLLTEKLAGRWLGWLLPPTRPTDAMPLTLASPQEDEFALCNLGVPSPYLTVAFPNRPPQDPEYADLEGVGPAARERWKKALVRFLKAVALASPGRRLVVKSPLHTCRIEVLLECFPDARFVHIVREPHAVFASTVNMWRAMYRWHGLQTPTFEGLEDNVLEVFERMAASLERGRRLVEPSRFHELRYEDVVADPLSQMRTLYERLALGDFAPAAPAVEAYLARAAGFRSGGYEPASSVWRGEVSRRWGPLVRRHGYEV